MKLLLARHGNTFEAGAPTYVVGRGEDLALTGEGRAQAGRLAAYLRLRNLVPAAIYHGNLSRTRETATIIAEALDVAACAPDDRLTELDYGDWAGRSMSDIRAACGDAEVSAWDLDGEMPGNRGWNPSMEQVRSQLHAFLADMLKHHDCPPSSPIAGRAVAPILAITSNGILRVLPRLIEGLHQALRLEGGLKTGTGHLCSITHANRGWACDFWNLDPKTGG